MNEVRLVLFDLGNVLVRYDPDRFRNLITEQPPEPWTETLKCLRAKIDLFEAGKFSSEEFRREIVKMRGGLEVTGTFDSTYALVLPEPVPGMEEVVRRVSERYETALVSNTSPIHFDHCLKIVPALRFFRRFHLSYEMGCLKPEPEFYASVISAEGITPDEAVFIDDVTENIEAAQQAGMHALQFQDPETLIRQMHPLLPRL